ncbi:hypothetical protein L5G32_00475 [Gordonia sp. HY002]|uniref:hypothetical protein n=1 Tax=Gordonia zhenghanii TaxID=2911516 RepID=UPI001EF0E410|nr:hypothetical protein [Gordonia zhenghanii]MCF8568741.1 hypothetical protein [Gordonia zhenghanii]MCF8607042.1 hypothetical protein [Gordonia zhenghanii]
MTAVDNRVERARVARVLIIGVLTVYFGALAAYTVYGGIGVDFDVASWIGMGSAYLALVVATILVSASAADDLTDRRARSAAVLIVAGVAATWTSAAYAGASGLGDYQPMLSTATVVAVILMLRGRVLLVWAAIGANVAIGLIAGPFTESPAWFNAVLPRASLTVLFLATCTAILLGPQIAEMRALAVRLRADDKDARDRRHDIADRDDRIRRIDARVRPLLTHVADGHTLTDADIAEARLVEAKLRDGIRGRALDVPRVRNAVWEARRRGVSVSVLDDGGLAAFGSDQSATVVDAAAEVLEAELAGLSSGDVVARIAPAGREPVATVVVATGSLRRRIELGTDGFVMRTVES